MVEEGRFGCIAAVERLAVGIRPAADIDHGDPADRNLPAALAVDILHSAAEPGSFVAVDSNSADVVASAVAPRPRNHEV
jgi:hypothetical protein